MARTSPTTQAKRQREADKKRTAVEKRARRDDRKNAGPAPEEPIIRCMPILD